MRGLVISIILIATLIAGGLIAVSKLNKNESTTTQLPLKLESFVVNSSYPTVSPQQTSKPQITPIPTVKVLIKTSPAPTLTPMPPATPPPVNTPLPRPSLQTIAILEYITPTTGAPGENLFLKGKFFGTEPGSVLFYSPANNTTTPANISNWQNQEINAVIPSLTSNTNYQILVATKDGTRSLNFVNFQTKPNPPDPPEIISIQKESATSSHLIIQGHYFGNNKSLVTIFNADGNSALGICVSTLWSEEQIHCYPAPPGLTKGSQYFFVVTGDPPGLVVSSKFPYQAN